MKDRLAKSVFWMVWSRGVVQVVSFLSTLLVARLLAPADYGIMALAATWTNTIALMAEMGLGAAIIQFPELDDEELNAAFWLTMAMAMIAYAGLFFAAPALEAWFATPRLASVLRVAGLMLPLTAVRVVPDGLLRKRLELDRISQADILGAVVTIPVTVVLAWWGAGVWALVAASLTMPLTQTVVSFVFVRWRPGLRAGGRRLREVLEYSVATLGARAAWLTYHQADAVVLGKVSGDVALGLYSMAMQLASLPVHKVSAVVNQLASPLLAELQDDVPAMRRSLLRALRLVACVTFPLCIGLLVTADDAVRVLLTDKWLPAVPALRILCIYGVIKSLDVLLYPVLMARYRVRFIFVYTLALLIVMPAAFWMGAVWGGANGVAVMWVVVYPIVLSWMVAATLRELGLSWRTIWAQVKLPAAASVLMAATVLGMQSLVPGSSLPDSVLRLGLAVVIGAGVYSAAILWWGGAVVEEIVEIAGWLIRPRRAITRGSHT